jgi:hypothetical protein
LPCIRAAARRNVLNVPTGLTRMVRSKASSALAPDDPGRPADARAVHQTAQRARPANRGIQRRTCGIVRAIQYQGIAGDIRRHPRRALGIPVDHRHPRPTPGQ